MIRDIQPILEVLSDYLQKIPLSDDETNLLRSWLRESEANEMLFDDISNRSKWEADCPPGMPQDLAGSMERIRMRMIEHLENEG
ncbi:MAG TPA: hypothetical protein VFC34_05070 [Puia sp.]|nr:hypothetical protein [Puia sp.]